MLLCIWIVVRCVSTAVRKALQSIDSSLRPPAKGTVILLLKKRRYTCAAEEIHIHIENSYISHKICLL